MIKYILVGIFAVGCSKKGDDCDRAWDHMQEVSKAELKNESAETRALADKAAADDGPRKVKFVAACKAGKIDSACILAAKDTMGYVGCLAPK